MKYSYLIQNCDAEVFNLSSLEPIDKDKIKVIFTQDENGRLLRHWSSSSATNSILYPNSIYLLEARPSCSSVLLPQPNLEYLSLSNITPDSQLPLVGDRAIALLEKGVFFEVSDVNDSKFIILLTNQQDIQKARNMINKEESMLNIMGKIVKSPIYYNSNYSYYIDPNTIAFFELAIEVCDSTFDYIENNLDEVGGSFLPNNTFCPWSSKITRELSPIDSTNLIVEDVKSVNNQIQVKFNKNTNISIASSPVFIEFFSQANIPGSVTLENYCLDD